MSRMWSLVLVAAIGCGGPKPHATSVPLPPDKPAQPPPPPKVAVQPKTPEPPPGPPPATGPAEVTVPANSLTVKLVSPGKGKRSPVRYATKAGDKQKVEIAMDFEQVQAEKGQPASTAIIPTIILAGEAETKSIDKDGKAAFELIIATSDARDVQGAVVKAADFKKLIAPLSGMVISSTVDPHGAVGAVKMRVENANANTADALQIVQLTLPGFPILPSEPIAVGAKWQATGTSKLSDKIAVQQVTDYEAVAHTGTTWTIKGTTKITGADQDLGDGTKISGIKGAGTTEMTFDEGTLYPTTKGTLQTEFTATGADQAELHLSVKIGGAMTPAKK